MGKDQPDQQEPPARPAHRDRWVSMVRLVRLVRLAQLPPCLVQQDRLALLAAEQQDRQVQRAPFLVQLDQQDLQEAGQPEQRVPLDQLALRDQQVPPARLGRSTSQPPMPATSTWTATP